eukprot:scaffold220991_cov32-Tisochrysis_lutea.AAC.2
MLPCVIGRNVAPWAHVLLRYLHGVHLASGARRCRPTISFRLSPLAGRAPCPNTLLERAFSSARSRRFSIGLS